MSSITDALNLIVQDAWPTVHIVDAANPACKPLDNSWATSASPLGTYSIFSMHQFRHLMSCAQVLATVLMMTVRSWSMQRSKHFLPSITDYICGWTGLRTSRQICTHMQDYQSDSGSVPQPIYLQSSEQ